MSEGHLSLTLHEAGLSELMARSWAGDFRHSFMMPQPKGSATHWHRWRSEKGHSSDWRCVNLCDASSQYCWDYVTSQQNKGTSEGCRGQLLEAISSLDELSTERACISIFSWGGVGRSRNDPSKAWIRQAAKS